MIQRAIYVVLWPAALIGLFWLYFTENYEGLLIFVAVGLAVVFVLFAFLYIASAPQRPGFIEKAMQRRSAKAATKELLARVGRK